MTSLRAGTRGSDLALSQTRWVCERLRAAHTSIDIEEVIVKTYGDSAVAQPLGTGWPAGGFVGALETALARGDVDLAVHSYKDLPTAAAPGLVVAAVPRREVAHDILVTRKPVDLERLPAGFRIGTSSPRRAAQCRRLGDVAIVPIRGNVPSRIAGMAQNGLDGVVLAAAGVRRLGIDVPHRIDLPVDRFVPAPAQGALAVQARRGSRAAELVAVLNDASVARLVTAERSFLQGVAAGCHTPVGALATIEGALVCLRGQLFSDDGARVVDGTELGEDAGAVGRRLAARLRRALSAGDGARQDRG